MGQAGSLAALGRSWSAREDEPVAEVGISISEKQERFQSTHHPPERLNFLNNQPPHTLGALLLLKAEVELLLALGLICGLMPNGEVRVLERLVARDTLSGIKGEKLGEKVEGERVGLRVELLERNASLVRQGADVVLGLQGDRGRGEVSDESSARGGARERNAREGCRHDEGCGLKEYRGNGEQC